MKVRDVETGFVIKLERGEKVLATLIDFCEKRGIKGGVLHAIGAVKNTEIGYYNLQRREYFFKMIPEDREVASMTGNIALVDPDGKTSSSNGAGSKPFLHVHMILSACDESLSCVGGHLKEAEVAVTLEVYLTPFPVTFERKYDEDTGLKLLHI